MSSANKGKNSEELSKKGKNKASKDEEPEIEDLVDEEAEAEEGGEEALLTLPPGMLKKVVALKTLHASCENIDVEYRVERIQLEVKYREKRAAIYEERRKIVGGLVEVPDDPSLPSSTPAEGEEPEKGLPNFWLQALANNHVTGELITEEDTPALGCLEDIKCTYNETYTTFTLSFEFGANDFFNNTVLTKTYTLSPDLLDEKSPSLVESVGTEIDWKAGKNLCVTEIKKKQKAKSGKNKGQVRTVVRQVPKPSFFHYFSDPKEDDEEEQDEEKEEPEERIKLTEEEDFDVAHAIRTFIVPDAIQWYTGEAQDGDDYAFEDGDEEDEEDEDEEGEEGGNGGDEDDDDEDEAPKKATKKGGKNKGGFAAGGVPATGGEQPECKQN